jgi:hypothetical protein
MNYTALGTCSSAATKSCCTIYANTAYINDATNSFRSFIHTQNDTLQTTALKLLFVLHYVSLHFTMPYLTQNSTEQEGMEWPGWENQHPQRVIKLMEEEVPDRKSFCVQMCKSWHTTLCPDISFFQFVFGQWHIIFSHLSLLYFRSDPYCTLQQVSQSINMFTTLFITKQSGPSGKFPNLRLQGPWYLQQKWEKLSCLEAFLVFLCP